MEYVLDRDGRYASFRVGLEESPKSSLLSSTTVAPSSPYSSVLISMSLAFAEVTPFIRAEQEIQERN